MKSKCFKNRFDVPRQNIFGRLKFLVLSHPEEDS
jgi:hypothetical protein